MTGTWSNRLLTQTPCGAGGLCRSLLTPLPHFYVARRAGTAFSVLVQRA